MDKRKDAQIYIYGHKPVDYGYWDNKLYTPLEVGAALRDKVLDLRDNTGDNISEWNDLYAEQTGAYWVWKNVAEKNPDLEYIGVCQYRRRYGFVEDFNFHEIFDHFKVVLCKPLMTHVYNQYCSSHDKEQIDLAKKVLLKLYPEYEESWDKYIANGNKLYYSAGLITTREEFIKYHEWLFSIFDELKKEMNFVNPHDVREYADTTKKGKANNKYQSQVFGFLAERLCTLYMRHNFPDKIFELNYTLMEKGMYNPMASIKLHPLK